MKNIRKKIIGIIIFGLMFCLGIPKIIELASTQNIKNKETIFSSLVEASAPYAVISAGGLSSGMDPGGHAQMSGFHVGDIENGGNTNHMYTYIPDTFCAGHGWCLTRLVNYIEGSPYIIDDAYLDAKQEVDYEHNKTTEMVQSIAYARWFGASPDTMQKIVWASWQWSGNFGSKDDSCLLNADEGKDPQSTSSAGLIGRSYLFANFAYRALNNSGKLGLKCVPLDSNLESLRTMIDQGADTYTVGPFKVSFDNQKTPVLYGNGNMGDLVRNEIINNFDGKFCAGSISADIKFQDGSSKTNESVEILDTSGFPIDNNFPYFDQLFYVRYKSSKTEQAVEMIQPKITIEYYQKFTGKCYTYNSTHIKYSMIKDNGGVLEKALNRSGRIMRNYKQVGFWYEREFSTFKDFPVLANGGDYNQFAANLMRRLATHAIDLENNIKSEIEDICADWEMTDVRPLMTYYAGLWWEDEFYEITGSTVPYIKISSVTGGDKYWEYTKEGEDTVKITDPNDSRRSDLIDEGYEEKEGHDDYVATAVIENPLGSMSSFKTTGSAQDEATAKQDAIDKMKEKVEDIYIAIKITELTIDEDNEKIQPAVQFSSITASISAEGATFGARDINMYIGGNVWQALPENKTGGYGNRQNSASLKLGGIQVELIDDTTNTSISISRTDSEGEYGFQKLHPLHKYRIVFTYDGMRFENTEYTNDLSGGYSTAQEINRTNFNDIYDEIQTSPQNYFKDGQWRKAYRTIF